MEGFIWWGQSGVLGRKSPSGVQVQSPGRESGGRGPTEAEAKCQISVQLLTFACR